MLRLLSTPRQMVLSIVLVCSLLFISSSSSSSSSSLVFVSAEEETLSLRTVPGDERYQRRKTWDAFGFLMMMVGGNGGCGPLDDIRIGDHKLCNECTHHANSGSCNTLCSMSSSNSRKTHYSKFCDSTTSTSSSESNSVDAYNDNSAPGSVTTEGNYSKGFQFWMVATAASVGLALVAIHLGQRKERETDLYPDGDDDNESLSSSYSGGANARGSVGLRLAAVSAFADGMMPISNNNNKQVELAEYQLDDTPPPPSYPQSALV